MNLEEKTEELSKKIELSLVFEELRAILDNFEEDKMRHANQELVRRESVESLLRTIHEEFENDSRAMISEDLGNGGARFHFWNSKTPTLKLRCWSMLNREGAKRPQLKILKG